MINDAVFHMSSLDYIVDVVYRNWRANSMQCQF